MPSTYAPLPILADDREALASVLAGPTSPSRAFRVVGTATLHAAADVTDLAAYPGADTSLSLEPQTAVLETNGYYVRVRFVGTVTGRGYYGGDLDVLESYHWMPYLYSVREALESGAPVVFGSLNITFSL